MDTHVLIISICVVIPAIIAFTVCGIIYYSRQNKNREFRRQRSTPDDYHRSHEQRPQDEYIIDYPSAYRHQQQRRLRELSSVSEQSSPSYNNYPTNQIRRQQLPLFSPIHTTPTIARVHPNSPVITPSRYSSMPPSYDELFLQPHTLTNR